MRMWNVVHFQNIFLLQHTLAMNNSKIELLRKFPYEQKRGVYVIRHIRWLA